MNPIKILDVRAHPGDSAFLLDDGKTAILYDSGFAFTGYAVADRIKAYLGERPLDYIFLTHSHYDHALGSVYALQYWPNATVVAGEYAVRIFQKDSAKRVMRDLDRKFATQCGVSQYEDLIDGLRVDLAVKEGDTVQAGDLSFSVINLPGHTKCSVGFYLASQKLLLSCETIGVFDGDHTVLPSYLVGYQMALDSIAKVEQLEIEQILVPHFGLLDEQQTAVYLKNAQKSAIEVARAITDILRQGGSKEDAAQYFRQNFYRGAVESIYPRDAFELNTSIMIDLLERELLSE
ncbi:MAG: MBL fold metallo-hydrolase [Clostridia bacterium]|nr:MBL fold metallo-hydrolase [Clostridia bacterium]